MPRHRQSSILLDNPPRILRSSDTDERVSAVRVNALSLAGAAQVVVGAVEAFEPIAHNGGLLKSED